jgi:hypothetical protein
MRQPAAYRDGAVVDGLVATPGTALEPLTPGTAGAVTETPGTPGIATLVPAGLAAPDTVAAAPGTVDPGTVFATPGTVAVDPGTVVATPGTVDPGTVVATPGTVDPGTVVATPGMAAAVPGTPGTFEVMSFAPGIIVVTPCAPGTEVAAPAAPGTDVAAPAAPGTAVAALPGAVGVIEDFAPSRRIFSPSFITPCARAMGAVIAKPSTAIVHMIVGRIGCSHLQISQHRSWWGMSVGRSGILPKKNI